MCSPEFGVFIRGEFSDLKDLINVGVLESSRSISAGFLDALSSLRARRLIMCPWWMTDAGDT